MCIYGCVYVYIYIYIYMCIYIYIYMYIYICIYGYVYIWICVYVDYSIVCIWIIAARSPPGRSRGRGALDMYA